MTVRTDLKCTVAFAALLCLSAMCAAGGVYDDLETYTVGNGLLGQGIWSTWSGIPAEDGVVSNERAATGAKSLKIVANNDVIANIAQTAGVWDVRAKVYIPADHTGSSAFIIMNEFGATQAWALQLSLNGTATIIYDDAADPKPSLPLVVGAWSEIRTIVNLGTNKQDIYYNGAPLALGVRWAEAGKAVAMTVIDLYGGTNGTAVYWDDISVAEAVTGIETAGALLVNLDARDYPEGAAPSVWANAGALGDFNIFGTPVVAKVSNAIAISFNNTGTADCYQCATRTPATLTGLNPTRTAEVWAYNPAIADEETLLSWGRRGGDCGQNMSFNYGTNGDFGALGMWCGQDIGWGKVPTAGAWHHLVATYDGTTTRVYSDGVQTNIETLGAGAVNTHPDFKILIAAQTANAAGNIEAGLKGTLSIARVRIHDGCLTDAQVAANFQAEYLDFPENPKFTDAPGSDTAWKGSDLPYIRKLTVVGRPTPTLAVLAPEGATITEDGLFSYTLPEDVAPMFAVRIEAKNSAATVVATWAVTVKELPPDGELAVGGELFVDLSAADATAGTPTWANPGTLGDFVEVGDPLVVEIAGAKGVSFNSTATVDSYQQPEAAAPAGLVGLNATSTIEAWVYTESIPAEQTILAWGTRGPNAGNNMSFNYGSNGSYGAMGHWGNPDMGWRDTGGAPVAKQWHHMAYTFDGTTQRVFADGELWNSEYLGAGVVNPIATSKITLACQLIQGGAIGDTGLRGVLTIGKVRIHNEPLSLYQLRHNYQQERPAFPALPPVFLDAPAEDFVYTGAATYTRTLNVSAFGTAVVEVLAPAGATIEQLGALQFKVSYAIPAPEPDGFAVSLKLSDDFNSVTGGWNVTVVKPLAGISFGPVHRYSFTENANDSVGTAHGTAYGNVTYAAGQAVLGNNGSQYSNGAGLFPDPIDPFKAPPGAYIDLPNGIVSALGNQATFEAWVTWNGPIGSSWQRIFDFGTSDGGENLSPGAGASYYIFATPRSGDNTLRFGANNPLPTRVERWIQTARLADQSQQHVAVVWDGAGGSMRMFLNGVLVAQGVPHFALSDLPDVNNWLGRAQWGDPMFAGSFNEFRIYDYAMSPAEVLTDFQAGPDSVKVLPTFVDAPASDTVNSDASPYLRELTVTATGEATLEVLSPAGATVNKLGARTFQVQYAWPEPPPASFTVAVRLTDDVTSIETSWDVTVVLVGKYVNTGDANVDTKIDIGDAICILGWLFGAKTDPCKTPKCLANMNTNDDAGVDIGDAISLLGYLFAGQSMKGPDGTLLKPVNAGCKLYPAVEVTLPCDQPCTP